MAINGLQNILQESDQIAKLPNVGAKWKYIAVHMGLDQQNGNSFYNYFISLNNNILFLVRNGNHNNINEQLYNMHEKLGRPNKRYIIFFKGMNESTDTTTKFLEAEHHTVNFPVNALDSVENVKKYIHSLIKLFEDGGTEFPKLPIKPSLQAPSFDKARVESINRNRTIRLTESKLRNIIKEATRRSLEFFKDSPRSFEDTLQRLRNGENPEGLFSCRRIENDGNRVISFGHKYNLLNSSNQLMSDVWFDSISPLDVDGCRTVSLNGKRNLINKDGEIVMPKWVDDIWDHDKYGRICVLNHKRFRIDVKDGKIWYRFGDVPTNENNQHNNRNMKQTIKLTESELRKIISNKVRQFLKEGYEDVKGFNYETNPFFRR